MPFVAGKDQSADRARYHEDELVTKRAKRAAEIIREDIRSRGISQAQYCHVFGFKAQQTIHNHFRNGKVTLIDLIRIVSTPGFNISVDDALRQAIKEIEYIDQSSAPVEEPKTEPGREKEPKKAGVDPSVLMGTSFARFSDLFSNAPKEEGTD